MSVWKNSGSWKRGQIVEKDFAKLLELRNIEYAEASREDQFKHIDYHTTFGTIDVKSKKRVNRRDDETQEWIVWLEFKNINGYKGWMCGDTDVIAFERNNDFVLVKRVDLLKMANKKCDLKNMVDNPRNALYKGYQRKDRKDLLSLVKMSDILEIDHRIWKKQ